MSLSAVYASYESDIVILFPVSRFPSIVTREKFIATALFAVSKRFAVSLYIAIRGHGSRIWSTIWSTSRSIDHLVVSQTMAQLAAFRNFSKQSQTFESEIKIKCFIVVAFFC